MAGGIKPPLAVRSDTLVGRNGPAVTTTPGTMDRNASIPYEGSADNIPQARGFAPSPLSRGDAVVSSTAHYSWKALQGSQAPMVETQHQPMTGAVRQNKAPF